MSLVRLLLIVSISAILPLICICKARQEAPQSDYISKKNIVSNSKSYNRELVQDYKKNDEQRNDTRVRDFKNGDLSTPPTDSVTTATTPTATTPTITTPTITTPTITTPTGTTTTTPTTTAHTTTTPTRPSTTGPSNTTNTSLSTLRTTLPPESHICCEEKDFQTNLSFPATQAGSWAIPQKSCLQANYTLVMRYCFENETWDVIRGCCSDNVSFTNITITLYGIVIKKKENSTTALSETLYIINTEAFEDVSPEDIYLIAKILERASEDGNIIANPEKFNKIIDKVMGVEKNILASSQHRYNSTDIILYSLDKLLLKTNETQFASLPRLLIHSVNTSEGVIGIIIKNNGTNDDFTTFNITSLYNDNSQNQLEDANLETAVLVPSSLAQNHNHYFITLFYNDNFFNQEKSETEFSIGSWIVSILIPDITTDDSSTIKIYYKEFTPKLRHQCNHWRYGKDEENHAIKGSWSSDGNATKFKDGFYICETNHTTHFAMLFSDSVLDNFALDFITIFGLVLSIVGILIIFLTALVFKNWKNNPTNKVILNIATCLLLLIILFFISDQVHKGISCMIVGILLHYMILVQFCWMLTVSYSSFRRLTLNLHYHIENVVVIYCVICWGIPLIIVGIVSAISVQTYDKRPDRKSSEICYPKGIYFRLGLLMPIGIILTINLIIYILIMKAITFRNFDVRKHRVSTSRSKQKSIIFLFFMMGITWIFGFLTAFIDSIVFAYLFCTTATCHGFVMFVYYILDATKTKELWWDKIQKLFRKKSKQRQLSVVESTIEFE